MTAAKNPRPTLTFPSRAILINFLRKDVEGGGGKVLLRRTDTVRETPISFGPGKGRGNGRKLRITIWRESLKTEMENGSERPE